MQTFLKILGFITIFLGIIIGIYVISDALSSYASIKISNDPYREQIYTIKLFAGGVIILSSIVSGLLYLSFGIVIELLDSINHKIMEFVEQGKKKEETAETY